MIISNSPPKLYDLRHDGLKVSLVAVSNNAIQPDDILRWCESAVQRFVHGHDMLVLAEIAAGAAATVIFAKRMHKRFGLNRGDFCRQHFGRDIRTVKDWSLTAQIYDEIGGPESAIQPSAFSQILALKSVQPTRRKECWDEVAGATQSPPTGRLLLEWAEANKALLRTKSCSEEDLVIDTSIATMAEAQRNLRALVRDGSHTPEVRRQLLRLLCYFEAKVFPLNPQRQKNMRSSCDSSQPELFAPHTSSKPSQPNTL